MNRSILATCISFFLLFSCFSSLLFCQSQAELDSLQQTKVELSGKRLVDCYLSIARQHVEMTPNLDSSRSYVHRALAMSIEIPYDSGLSKSYFMLGHIYRKSADFDSSDYFFMKSLELAEANEDLEMKAAVYNNFGTNHLLQDQYEPALEHFFTSLALEEQRGEEAESQQVLGNISLVYASQGEPRQGLPYLQKALTLSLATRDTFTAIQNYNNLSNFYTYMEILDSASYFAEKVLNLSREIGLIEGVVRAGALLGKITFIQGKPQESLAWAQEAIKQAEAEKMYGPLEGLYLNLGHVHDALGHKQDAVVAGETAITYARLSKLPIKILAALEDATKFHKRAGNFEQALARAEEAHQLNDSLFSVEKINQLRQLQTEFDTERKQQEIQRLEQETNMQAIQIRQRSMLVVATVLIALLALGAVYFYNKQRILQEQQQVMEAKQQTLRSQMNPHFLFHALSSIQDYLYTDANPATAARYLAKFAKLMRLILENSREDLIPLDQEIRTLSLYMDLQQVRYQHAFSYDIHVDPSIDSREILIPPMVAQPFIENALEHGRIHEQSHGKVFVRFAVQAGRLEIRVEDNGIGRKEAGSKAKNSTHRSLATEITEDRLELLRKKYKQAVDLSITDRVEADQISGVSVFLALPIVSQDAFLGE